MFKVLITSSVLIAALLVLRQLFRRTLSRRVQYALWGLVLVRLLVPVDLPAADFSVLTAVRPVEEQVMQRISTVTFPALPVSPGQQTPQSPVQAGGQPDADSPPASVQVRTVSLKTLLTAGWIAGSAVAAGFLLYANLRFWQNLRRRRRLYPVEDCPLRVYLVEESLPSPCLFGLFRPAVYLTPAAAASPERLRHVLAHEETHARHLDHIWALLRGVCLVIYWFDPLVWLAASAAKADCELACDESVLLRLGEEERVPYGQTLLSLIPVGRAGDPLLAATTMAAGKRQLKDRIRRIAQKPRQLAFAVAAALLLAGLVSACAFTGGKPGGGAGEDPAGPAPALPVSEPEREDPTLPAQVLPTLEPEGEVPTGSAPVLPASEPEAVISLRDLEPYEAPKLTVEAPVGDFTDTCEAMLENWNLTGCNVVVYRTTGGNVCAAVRRGEAVKVFLSEGLDGEHRFFAFSNLLGHDGFAVSHSGQIAPHSYGTLVDYFYFEGDDTPVLLARASGDEPLALDLDGDGDDELCTESEIFFQREGVLYRADLEELVMGGSLYGVSIDRYAKSLFLSGGRYTEEQGGRTIFRWVYFTGDELLAYRNERQHHDHMVDGADQNVPDEVVDAARTYVENEVLVRRLNGTWRHKGWWRGEGYPQETYDDWRIERITRSCVQAVGDTVIEGWRFNYELHVVDPENVVLAGGKYFTEDDWVSPGYPNCDWLFFRVEAEGKVFLWHDIINDMAPNSEGFREHLSERAAQFVDVSDAQQQATPAPVP